MSSWDHSKYGQCPVLSRRSHEPCERTPIGVRIRNGTIRAVLAPKSETEQKFCESHVGLAVLLDDDLAAKVDAEWLADLCEQWEVRDDMVVPR